LQKHLSRQGFEELFLHNTLEDAEETFKDLLRHGYDRSLQLVKKSS
jgi:hypothetical protein